MTSSCRAIALVVIVSASMMSTSRAEQFRMPGTPYSVDMPGTPECWNRSVELPWGATQLHVCAYFDEKLGRGYSIEYFGLPRAPEASAALLVLKGAAIGAAANSSSDVVETTELQIDGYPALEAALLTPANGFVAHVRYVLVESDVVTVTVDGGRSVKKPLETIGFLNSLRFLKNETSHVE